MDEIYNPDDQVEHRLLADDTELVVRCQCPACSRKFSTALELFYPQDIGDEEFFNSYKAICPNCGRLLIVVAPEGY